MARPATTARIVLRFLAAGVRMARSPRKARVYDRVAFSSVAALEVRMDFTVSATPSSTSSKSLKSFFSSTLKEVWGGNTTHTHSA